MSTQHTPRTVDAGEYAGHPIRLARKNHHCDNGPCNVGIKKDDLYVEGWVDPYRAGGFGMERFCAKCVDDDARAAIAKATS